MTKTSADLSLLVSEFLAGDITLADLDAEIARIGDQPLDNDPALMAFWGTLELLVAEFAEGVLPESEFREELAAAHRLARGSRFRSGNL